METSAKENQNISEIFYAIGKVIKENLNEPDTKPVGGTGVKISSNSTGGGDKKKNCEC